MCLFSVSVSSLVKRKTEVAVEQQRVVSEKIEQTQRSVSLTFFTRLLSRPVCFSLTTLLTDCIMNRLFHAHFLLQKLLPGPGFGRGCSSFGPGESAGEFDVLVVRPT